jgi:hypothetical protein
MQVEVVMKNETGLNRRLFVACCACGCAGLASGATSAGGAGTTLSWTKTPGEKKSYDLAYCGIYCASCEIHLKGGKDGKKCKGCTHPSKESTCKVFLCAKAKGVANCGLCASFETCEIAKQHHEKPLYRQVARRTCQKIKASGLVAVAAEQKARWTCKACGKLFPWNTKGACPHCGKPVEPLSEKDLA